MTAGPVRPEFDGEQARRLLAEHYPGIGEQVAVRELPSYIDRNFRVDVDGARYVFKIAAAETSRGELEFECEGMHALSDTGGDLQCPEVVAASDGADLIDVRDRHGTTHVARLVSFVPGTLLADCGRPSDALLFDFGRKLALADSALASVGHPMRHRTLSWDLAHAGWIADHIGDLPRDSPRAAIDAALLQFRSRIAPALDSLPRAVIHNDANDQNVTIDGDRVVGLFDFGDMVESCRMFEPAIAATYAAFHRPDDPEAAICELAAGYHQVLRFEPLELDLLFTAIRTRLAVSLVSSARASKLDPDNAYASASEAQGRALLGRLHARSDDELTAALYSRCDVPDRRKPDRSFAELTSAREQRIGPNLGLSYQQPLWIRRGRGAYLFDHEGQAFLDCVNNVCHVGHCHPWVVTAAAEQMGVLNTNTRYLHEGMLDYTEALLASFPDHLEVCFLVCSGSEANELALRLARTHTGRESLMVLDHAYHGNTGGLVALSPYKFDGPGGAGVRSGVHVVPAPDPYRNPKARDGAAFAEATVGAAIREHGPQLAAFLAESLPGCGGQIIPPDGYLARAFELAREAGVVTIADEVQVGFGRVGSHMWAFEAQGARPDIVTLGKPIGNGHPMGAVVTTRAIADDFANGMEYFNTFGGNPVSAAVGSAVLDVIRDEGLMAHAAKVGNEMMASLRQLAVRHPAIGDVRGLGLFIGVELVTDRDSKQPAAELADAVIQHCRNAGVLLSTDGPLHNVLKIKPPLAFDEVDAALAVRAIDRALSELSEA